MSINSKYITPQFKKEFDPKIGLITLSTDYTMESDFHSICRDLPLDVFVNRIANYNPLTKENLLKMYDQLESVTKNILPGEKINTVAYGCTSGTIAIGKNKVEENNGIIIKGEGDAFWIVFDSATKAVQSAISIQNELREDGVGKKENARLSIRISITLGDIIEKDKDIFGEAVNLCSRIESITPSDEIYLSNSTFLALRKNNIQTSYIGEYDFKGFSNKEKVYKVFLKHNTVVFNDCYIWFSDIEKFSNITTNIELTEKVYDKYDTLVQKAIQKYNAKIINIIGDCFILAFDNGEDMFKATKSIFIEWDKFLIKENMNNFVRVGVHRGTIRMYRALVSGNDFNIAARLESAAIGFDIKRRNIISITSGAYQGIMDKVIKNEFKILSMNKFSENIEVRKRLQKNYDKIYIFHT